MTPFLSRRSKESKSVLLGQLKASRTVTWGRCHREVLLCTRLHYQQVVEKQGGRAQFKAHAGQ